MRPGHTPGPWNVCGGFTPRYTAITAPGRQYIVFGMADRREDREHGELIDAPDYDTQRANVRLMAAAPDLLAVCRATAAIDPVPRYSPFGPDYMECPACGAEQPGKGDITGTGPTWRPDGEMAHTEGCPVILARAAISRATGGDPP